MTTMSTQPGSSASILKVPTTTNPDSPAIPEALGNVFLFASPTSWYVRWNGTGAYIGTMDRRKRSALRGMRLIRQLLDLKGESITTAELHGYTDAGFVEGNPIADAVYQDFGLPPRDDKEGGRGQDERCSGVHVANLVPDEAHESRDLAREFTHALELIGKKLPLLADHLGQRMSTPLRWLEKGTHNKAWKYDKAWRYADDETQWTFGAVWDFDGSNLFVGPHGAERRWHLRFGEHECMVPDSDSDGMLIVAALLRSAGTELTAEEVCNEAGVCLPKVPNAMIGESEVDLIDFVERVKEFGLGLAPSHIGSDESLDWAASDCSLEELPDELIDDLQFAAVKLKKRALEVHAAQTLRKKGIAHISNGGNEDFATLVAKLKRCEKLVGELQNWQGKEKLRSFAKVAKPEELNEALARRNWIIRSVNEAIGEIGKQSAYIGAYFQQSFRADNGRFVLDLEHHWIVD